MTERSPVMWNWQSRLPAEALACSIHYAEQTGLKGPIPSPEKYVDQSYLRQALKELGLR